MEWEDVEKTRVESLRSGVQGMGIHAGEAENFENEGLVRSWTKSQNP
jgi:hypothetical protein